jgi:hypothetical protein
MEQSFLYHKRLCALYMLRGRIKHDIKEIGMKWIGLIGGMSWESSAEYYRVINE